MSRPKTQDRNPNYDEVIARRIARRKWEINNPEKWEAQKQNQRLRRRYGITTKEYFLMLESQNGVCAICKHPPKGKHGSGRDKKLHVDHNHDTGEIRGLLCDTCNRGLGMFKENLVFLSAAMEYLNAHR